jgi:kynurenine formamidase
LPIESRETAESRDLLLFNRKKEMTRIIIDLSVKIFDGMPVHKNMRPPFLLPHGTHEASKARKLGTPEDPMTFASSYFAMNDHIGTHVDAFFHMHPQGLPIDEMDVSMFMGKAVAFDLRHIPDLGDISVKDMEEAERKAGVKVDGHVVLLCTGLHKKYFPSPEVSLRNAGVTAEATHWLADRGSKLHGVEGPSTDRPNDPTFPSHRACRDRQITHYEWLCNLEELVGKGVFEFQGIPLSLKGASGSPVRALAFLD